MNKYILELRDAETGEIVLSDTCLVRSVGAVEIPSEPVASTGVLAWSYGPHRVTIDFVGATASPPILDIEKIFCP